MPSTDPAIRRALSQQAIETRWGNADAADEAARRARTLILERAIRQTLGRKPALTADQREHLAGILTGSVR